MFIKQISRLTKHLVKLPSGFTVRLKQLKLPKRNLSIQLERFEWFCCLDVVSGSKWWYSCSGVFSFVNPLERFCLSIMRFVNPLGRFGLFNTKRSYSCSGIFSFVNPRERIARKSRRNSWILFENSRQLQRFDLWVLFIKQMSRLTKYLVGPSERFYCSPQAAEIAKTGIEHTARAV